ncbi:hypothetical protein TNCV_4155901 [Trichonephila clavipes]|nr:hypothetical protein TNCV_4155901 [Trichonephila clavipes]
MSSSPCATEDPLCRGADARYICRDSMPTCRPGVEVCRGKVPAEMPFSTLDPWIQNKRSVANNPRAAEVRRQ